MSTAFGTWLQTEIEKQGLTRREVARRLAVKHPEGLNPKTLESARRQIYKYLDPERPANPTVSTRAAFADVFGVDPSEIPGDEDEEDDLERALLAAVQRRAQLKTASAELERWISWGVRNGVFKDREEIAA